MQTASKIYRLKFHSLDDSRELEAEISIESFDSWFLSSVKSARQLTAEIAKELFRVITVVIQHRKITMFKRFIINI